MLNTGDIGLRRSLDKLTAEAASRSTNDGAPIAAHARHLQYRLSLMHRWAREGGTPFADIAHLAYHLGAIRQIERNARGPRGGTFAPATWP